MPSKKNPKPKRTRVNTFILPIDTSGNASDQQPPLFGPISPVDPDIPIYFETVVGHSHQPSTSPPATSPYQPPPSSPNAFDPDDLVQGFPAFSPSPPPIEEDPMLPYQPDNSEVAEAMVCYDSWAAKIMI